MKNKTRNAQNNNVNTNASLTREEVMNKVAQSFDKTKKAVNYFNYTEGLQLSNDECEEIVQSSLYKGLMAADRFDPSKASMATLVNKIAYNSTIDVLSGHTKSSWRDVPYTDDTDEDGNYNDSLRQMHFALDREDGGAADSVTSAEKRRSSRLKLDCLREAVTSLSSRDQSVVYMLLRGATGKEMADELHMTEVAQRKLVHDVRQRLSGKLNCLHYDDIEDRSDRYVGEDNWFDETKDETFGFFFKDHQQKIVK